MGLFFRACIGLVTLLTWTTVGCVDSSLVRCGERWCAAGNVCMAGTCASPMAVAACASRVDGETCQAGTEGTGICTASVCRVSICGDGLRSALEACDDGNTFSGDGCAANCASTEVCGNGVTDVNEECDDGNANDLDGCHHDCRVPKCGDGIVDSQYQETCDDGAANSDAPDASCRSNCAAPRCGDGIIDTQRGEHCDDGNITASDACQPTCQVPTCGDGIVDLALGEQCDPYGLSAVDSGIAGLSTDGCTANCKGESESWAPLKSGLPARYFHAMVTDTRRNRVVLFGGVGANGRLSDTWEFDGTWWRKMQPAQSPPATAYTALGFDEHRGVTVMFGGQTATGATDATWEYDGVTWKERTFATKPAARQVHSLTYDPLRQRMLLFGGANGLRFGDTWEYDGTAWVERDVATAPSARAGATLVFDLVRQQPVLFGGIVEDSWSNEVWTYDGATWQRQAYPNGPSGRVAPAVTWDAQHQALLVFGGGSYRNDHWELTATGWREVTNSTKPLARYASAAAYVPTMQATIVVGGFGYDAQNNYALFDDTWMLQANAWHDRTPAQPPMRYVGQMVYDRLRNRTVAFGGYGTSGMIAETWEFDGLTWYRVVTTQQPNARYDHAMAYDAARGRVVLVGGTVNGSVANDTWEYDGQDWTQRQLLTPAPARTGAAMAYDLRHKRMILFGGGVGPNASDLRADTWTYDGTSWQQLAPLASPLPTSNATMVYDEALDQMLLFGGFVNQDDELYFSSNTYAFDGTSWTELAVTVAPGARVRHNAAYSPTRRSMVIFGGRDHLNGWFGDTWELRDNRWSQLSTVDTPSARNSFGMSYATVGNHILLHSGWEVAGNTNDTWRFQYLNAGALPDACLDAAADTDNDGLWGCGDLQHAADPDCWGRCTPLCAPTSLPLMPPSAAWPSGCDRNAPHCGDGQCNGFLEDYLFCPADCAAP